MGYYHVVQGFDFSSSIFSPTVVIPPSAQIVFVADMFVDDYVGGAELTTEALIKTSPYEVFKVRSRDVTMDVLKSAADRFWIFGNFAELNPQLIPSIIGNLRYSVLEYDYKYCRARSPEKHLDATGMPCDCAGQVSGKLISAFYYGSMGIWWMSEAQRQRYVTMFPFLNDKMNIVLSSVFSRATLDKIESLRKATASRKGWIVLGSSSWIKGASDAEQWCKDNNLEHSVVWNVPYDDLLTKMASAEGFVYLPRGGDTCPRMVIEAKLLGCRLHINDNVQHASEGWFATDDLEKITAHLNEAPEVFWSGIKQMIEYRPTVSGYTTTYDCIFGGYPFHRTIKSMLEFCDEVCVVDGGSTDGTWESLKGLASRDPRVKIKQIKRDWKSKRHPVFDGMQKAEARAMCTKEFCWQMDSDEVVHENDYPRIPEMCRALPTGADVLALPVTEYWGGEDKVRLDIQPWKWRLSRNLPHITHGIPGDLRRFDQDGELYAALGTDGCDMIHKETFERLPFVSFYPPEIEQVRVKAMSGDREALVQYQQWFNQVVTGLPGVVHYSWYDLPRKIRLYRDYWQNHWNALWDKDTSDSATNNMMFGVPWAEVTDEMIEKRAAEMKEKLGGWVWHRPWDGKTRTPHLTPPRPQPAICK